MFRTAHGSRAIRDGNEVWLLAGGGTLYFAFPALYASSFSGFYLPLMIVLWLLIVRGISIEFRSHVASPLWAPLWDTGFGGASLLLAIFYGAALGNVVRGVPLDRSGYFFLPLWSDFRASSNAGILDWYTILTGVTALLALTMHGALWVRMKSHAPISESGGFAGWPRMVGRRGGHSRDHRGELRSPAASERAVRRGAMGLCLSRACTGGFAGGVSMHCRANRSAGILFFVRISDRDADERGLRCLPAPAGTDPALSLTINNAAAGSYGLGIGLAWWLPGMLLASGYAIFTYRRFAGKLR